MAYSKRPSILPLEGFTLEAAVAPLRLTLLQPLLTGPLLLALYRLPELATKFPSIGGYKPTCEGAITTLSLLFGIGVVRKVNNWLSHQVINNWTRDSTWNFGRAGKGGKEVIIVTGGSGGIGYLMVQQFAELGEGNTVIILDLSPPKTAITHSNVHFYKTDITSTPAIAEVAAQIRSKHGEPTVLINNAGVGPNKTLFSATESSIRLAFNVNTIAHFLLVKEFVPDMARKNHGHVVTIASMASFMVHAANVDYAATKASALAFHEGLAQELKSRYNANKVRTTVVHPTWIRTPLIEHITSRPGMRDFILEPATVADAIVDQVVSGYSGQLILPGRLGLLSGMRGFPGWLQEGMRDSVNLFFE